MTTFSLPNAPFPALSDLHAGLVGFVFGLPLPLQIFLILFITDFYYYWIHRLAHTYNWLWFTHSVHHSIKKVDWLGGLRIHVIDHAVFRIGQAYLYLLIGFSPSAVGTAMIVVPLYSSLLHLNIPWRIKFLESILATPFFHHWHHEIEFGNRKNYSNLFPVIDKLFGTLYLPKDWPKEVGIKDHPVSDYIVPQFFYPFVQWFKLLRPNKKASISTRSI